LVSSESNLAPKLNQLPQEAGVKGLDVRNCREQNRLYDSQSCSFIS